MQKSYVKIAAGVLSAALLFSGMNMNSFAKEKTDLPSAGIDFILASNGTSVKNIKDETDAKKAEQKESSTSSSSYGFTYWNWDDGSMVSFRNGVVDYWFDAAN